MDPSTFKHPSLSGRCTAGTPHKKEDEPLLHHATLFCSFCGCKHVSRVVTDSSNDLNFEVLLEFNARGIQKGGKVLGSVGVACSVDAPQKPAAEADGNDWAVR